jgi:glycosyltransferase involved in cell wall biosynthesis
MIVLLPAYQPGPRLLALVSGLREAAPASPVVVVDDGSGPAGASVVAAAGDLGCTVLRHATNEGKGAALRTGFRYAAQAHPGHDVVSADADGQHSVADVLRVAEAVRLSGRLVLGVRRFSGAVPLRRRLGNALTRGLFRAATGRRVLDTQTGLRGYPDALLDWLVAVPGQRFEYEMNVLLHAAREGHPVEETVVATTYLDGGGSHFGSVADSVRVYWPLLRFALSSPRPGGRPRS